MNQNDKYIENFLEMTATEGWKQFVSEAQEQLDAIRYSIFSTKNTDDFLISKGRVDVLMFIVGFEDAVRSQGDNDASV